MNETRPISDYLRPPYRLGAGLTPIEATGPGDAWLGASVHDDITETVATVLREGALALRDALPEALCHVAYLRGSPVFDRITLVAPVWEQGIDLLDLAPVIEELRREQGDKLVEIALAGARSKMAQELLGLGSKSGIAKALYRLQPPDDALYRQTNRPAVLAFIESLPRLLDAADDDVRAIVRENVVVKPRPGLEAHFSHVLGGLIEADLRRRIGIHLSAALPTLAPDLNPFLPVTTEAIARVQGAFELPDAGTAGEVLGLLRFAALTMPLLRPKTTSDLAFRLLTVVSQEHDLASAQDAVLAVARSLDRGEVLSRMRAAHPQLEVSLRPYVLQAPVEQKTADEWLDIAGLYRTSAGSLGDASSLVLTSVRDLAEPRWSLLEAEDQRPATIEKLRAAVEAPSEATIDALGESIFESTSVDIAAKVRGVYSL